MNFLKLILISSVSAITTPNSRCTEPPTKQDFDQTKYVGTWYSQDEDFADNKFQCVTAEYTPMENGNIKVFNRAWALVFYYSVTGSAECQSNGKCWVTFNLWGNPPNTSKKPNYNVIATDYEKYAIVYSC